MQSIGIDIGGTSIKIGVVSEDKIIEKTQIPTINDDSNKLLESIGNVVDVYFEKYDIQSIGIGVPGKKFGDKFLVVNLKLDDVDIEKYFKTRYNVKTCALNDVKCATFSEVLYGSLKDGDGAMFAFGTGVGAGIVIAGKIYCGSNGNAGEIGHQVIAVDGERCNCGNLGCYEKYASTKNFEERAKKVYLDDSITGIEVMNRYDNGDEKAIALVNEHVKYMAIGIMNIINILDINNIVIGGAISQNTVIINKLKEYIKLNKTMDEENKSYNIVVSKFQNDAGIIGAANLYKLN